MHARRIAVLTFLTFALVLTACTGPGGVTLPGVGAGGSGGPTVPAAFKPYTEGTVELDVTAEGGAKSVSLGQVTAAVSVPAGAAPAGSKWRLVPLNEAPAAVKKALFTGVYVDTGGSDPTGACSIGFSIPGTASPNASIVRISDDGKTTEVVATDRIVTRGHTVLVATVDGFSAYTTSEEDAEARDKAFQEREKKRGKQVDWTIKVSGTEQKKVEGWTFDYEFDLFGSGGGVGQAGTYKGHGSLSLDGKYKGNVAMIKSFGTVNGIGRDQNLTFTVIDPNLASLVLPGAPDDPQVNGFGTMKLDGMSSIDLTAVGPTVKGHASRKNEKGTGSLPFTLAIKGEDVQVEIENLGIFPGKILRTSQ